MEDIISQTKADFVRTKEQMARALATTPDDKLNWSPSPMARTVVQLAAHAAMAVSGIQGWLTGKPFPFADTAEFDAAMRADEKAFTTREQALSVLEQNSAEYLTWLDGLTSEQLGSTLSLFFGPIPMTVGITLPAEHMRGHIAQMDYIQTISGDHDWHMPSQKSK